MAWLSGQSYNTSCCVLYVLKTRYFDSAGDHKKWAFPLSSCDVTNACIICSAALWFKYFLIRLIFLIWNDDTRTMLEIWGFRVIVESNITPKFRACVEGVICESTIVMNGRETFDNCWPDPNSFHENYIFCQLLSQTSQVPISQNCFADKILTKNVCFADFFGYQPNFHRNCTHFRW